MTTAIVKKENTIPALSAGKFTVTPTGLILNGEPEWKEWEVFLGGMQKVHTAVNWVIGDALQAIENQYGENGSQMLEKFPEYEYDTLRKYQWVSDNIRFGIRIPNLSWSHHRHVAGLEPKEQKKWLEKAEKKEWSVNDLRQAIKEAGGDSERAWLRVYQVWNFGFRDERFGVPHPGNIPAQILMNLNHYYTDSGDLVVDLFAGGGVTIDVCESDDPDFGWRECKAFDIKPARKDIIEWDVVKNGLPKFKKAKIIFLDPPYWKQKKGDYSAHDTNLANMPLDQFHDELEKIIIESRKRAEIVALIIGPTQENWQLIDHAAEMIRRVAVPWHRIQVPYSTQQHGGAYVNKAKENKKWLYLARDLMIWTGTKIDNNAKK